MTSLVINSKRKCNLKPESQLGSRQHLSCYTETEKGVLNSSNGGDPPFRYCNNICLDCAKQIVSLFGFS